MTTMGQKVTGLNVTIMPLQIISDSRCPADPKVQCVWAGTVQIKARIVSGLGTSEMTLELNKLVTTESETITLSAVSPVKSVQTEIPVSSYRFTFDIKKR